MSLVTLKIHYRLNSITSSGSEFDRVGAGTVRDDDLIFVSKSANGRKGIWRLKLSFMS